MSLLHSNALKLINDIVVFANAFNRFADGRFPPLFSVFPLVFPDTYTNLSNNFQTLFVMTVEQPVEPLKLKAVRVVMYFA